MRTFHPIPPEYQKSCPNKERGPAQTKKGVPALKPTWSKNPNDLQSHFYEDCARPLHDTAKQGPPFPGSRVFSWYGLSTNLLIVSFHLELWYWARKFQAPQKKAIGWIFVSCLFWLKYVFSWRWIHCRSTAPRLNHTCTRPNDDGISMLYKSIYIWTGW